MILCTWDRQGLLAKAAAAFNTTRVNILSADAYTRKDQIVLDVFRVSNADHGSVTDAERLQQMLFLWKVPSLSLPGLPRFGLFLRINTNPQSAADGGGPLG